MDKQLEKQLKQERIKLAVAMAALDQQIAAVQDEIDLIRQEIKEAKETPRW